MAQSTDPQSSNELVGMEQIDDYIGRVRDFLDDNDSDVLGIHGIGGIGKTTLLHEINKNFDTLGSKRRFDRFIHLTMPKDFNIFKMKVQILESISQTTVEIPPEYEGVLDFAFDCLACECWSEMNSLVLLDEVWDGYDLRHLGFLIPSPGSKGKIIIASRSGSVFRLQGEMEATIQLLEVKPLNDSQSWILFKNQVRRDLDQENPTLLKHAKAIMSRCGGNPLALQIMGRTMSNAQSDEDWKIAEKDLAEYIDEVARVEEQVFCLLKFCFDRLKDDATRKCLQYCCLFKKEKTLQVDELIKSLDKEEFIHKSSSSTAQEILDDLVSAGFIQERDSHGLLKMHDVVSEMCEWLKCE